MQDCSQRPPNQGAGGSAAGTGGAMAIRLRAGAIAATPARPARIRSAYRELTAVGGAHGARPWLAPLDRTQHRVDPFALPPDELSALSVEQALRQRLDVRNRRVLPALQGFLVPFFFGALISAFVDFKGNGWPLAAAGLVVTIGSLVALRRLLPLAGPGETTATLRAPALAERFGELLQGLLMLEYLFGVGWIASIGGRPALIFMAAPALLMFRLVASELVLLHALCVVAGGVVWWATHADDALSAIVGATLVHLAAGGFGLLLTRRFRRRFLEQWRRQVGAVREQLRVRDELALARQVQLSMLPAAVPRLPRLDVAAACLPAYEVGGDYYDFFTAEDGLAVVVADVAGHGVASGLVLASVRSGLTLLMEEPDHQLGPTMVRLDRLVQRTARRMLVTLAIARFDDAGEKVTVATAGHPPVLVRRRSGEVEEVATPSPPLGTRLPAATAARDVPFGDGDCCLLYTDGLVEAPNAAGEAYGAARLAAVLAGQSPADGAQAICDGVLADLAAHRGAAAQQDDVTLVVVVGRAE
jgi:stage II sporulation SpoE-like protein